MDERLMALAMDHERWGPLPRLRLLLDGEMALLILLATPTPTGGVPAQLRLPSGTGALGPRRRACHSGRVPRRPARRVEVPRQLRHQATPGRIGLRELVLLRGRQVAPQIFDRTAQFNKHAIGQESREMLGIMPPQASRLPQGPYPDTSA
jgi:hypothetical protein